MSHIIMALILFLIIAVTHLLYCFYQKKDGLCVGMLLKMSSVGLGLLFILFAFFPVDPLGPTLKSSATIIYICLIPIALILYSFIDEPNPSRKILKDLETHPQLSYEELLASLKKEDFINKGLDDLLKLRFAIQKEDKLSLSFKGKCLQAMLKTYRLLSGQEWGR